VWIQRGQGLADFDRELRCDSLGDVDRNIGLARPPSSGVLIVLTVGSESSSATNGSSVESVAGKKRAPAKPCPYAQSVAPSSHKAQVSQKNKGKCFMNIPPA
jgi:hypothetical protein